MNNHEHTLLDSLSGLRCLSLSKLICDQCSMKIGVYFEVLLGTATFHILPL